MLSFRIRESQAGLKDFLMRHHFGATEPETSRPIHLRTHLGHCILCRRVYSVDTIFYRGSRITSCLACGGALESWRWYCSSSATSRLVRYEAGEGERNRVAGIFGGFQMLAIGAVAVGAAVGLVKAIEQGNRY